MLHTLVFAVLLGASSSPVTLPATVVPVDPQSLPATVQPIAAQPTAVQPTAVQPPAAQQQAAADDGTAQPAAVAAPDAAPPSPTLPGSGVGWILTNIGNATDGSIGPAMDMSVGTALVIFKYVAAISFLVNLISLYGSGADLPAMVITSFRKVFEWTFLGILIASTWHGPLGGGGWFPSIVGGLFNIGIQLAHAVAPGAPMPSNVSATLSGMAAYPGKIADFGAALYNAIMAAAPKMPDAGGTKLGPITLPIPSNPVTFMYFMAVKGVYWGFAVFAYINCIFVAIRYFLVYIRCLMIGFLSFFQGAIASQRMSSFASGMYTAPIVVGAEFCSTIVIIGLCFAWVKDLTGNYNICNTAGWGCSAMPNGSVPATLGDLVALGVVLTFWSYTVHRVPTLVADAIAGRISASTTEVRQAMSASPFIGARAAGLGGEVAEAGATGGFEGAAKTAFSPVAEFGRNAAVGATIGSSGGILKGAVGGLMLGGPVGMVGGVAGGLKHDVFGGGGDKGGNNQSDDKQKQQSNNGNGSSDSSNNTDKDADSAGANDNTTAEEASGESQGQKRTDRDADTDDAKASEGENGAGLITSGAAIKQQQSTPETPAQEPASAAGSNGASQNGDGKSSDPDRTPALQPTAAGQSDGQSNAKNEGGGASGSITSGAALTHQKQTTTTGDGQTAEGAGASDSHKTATQTTTVKRQTNEEGSGDQTKALQNLAAALNANTQAVQSGRGGGGGQSGGGGQGGGGSQGSGGGSQGSGGGSQGSGGAGGGGKADDDLGFENMSLGGMMMRQALYRSARVPTPPPPINEESAAIGGIFTGIH